MTIERCESLAIVAVGAIFAEVRKRDDAEQVHEQLRDKARM